MMQKYTLYKTLLLGTILSYLLYKRRQRLRTKLRLENTSREVIVAASKAQTEDPIAATNLDCFLRRFIIGTTFIFNYQIDSVVLKKAIALWISEYRGLAASFDLENKVIAFGKHGIELTIQNVNNSIQDIDTDQENDDRLILVHDQESEAITNGNASFTNVVLTKFVDGSTVGISLSHILGDGTNYYTLVKRLSEIYYQVSSNSYSFPENHHPIYDRSVMSRWEGKRRTFDETYQAAHEFLGIHKPIVMQPFNWTNPVAGALYSVYFGVLLPAAVRYERFKLHFTPEQLARLKAKAQKYSTLRISTNSALSAHLFQVISRYWNMKQCKHARLSNVTSLRGRLPQEYPTADFIGNPIVVSGMAVNDPRPLHEIGLSELAERIQDNVETYKDQQLCVEASQVFEDCFTHWVYPYCNIFYYYFSSNNHTKMGAREILFRNAKHNHLEEKLVDILPSKCGDMVLLYEAKDGGIDAYISLYPYDASVLLLPEYQKIIYSF